jgi:hypothetical protein
VATITGLLLGDNGLVGTIPTEIGHLTDLAYLDLGKKKNFLCLRNGRSVAYRQR